MSEFEKLPYLFRTDAYPDDPLAVVSFRGDEKISRTFRYEMELVSDRPGLDLDDILEKPCRLDLRRLVPLSDRSFGSERLLVHGALASLGQRDRTLEGWVRYRAVLVPRLWKTSLYSRCRIFIDRSVPSIVAEVLRDAGLPESEFAFEPLSRELPDREYVVQYRESDLAFVQRLCEHEGIFYTFTHGDDREKVLFADSGATPPAAGGSGAIPYNPEGAELKAEAVFAFDGTRSIVPSEVVLNEYNWRTPSVNLRARAPVEGRGAEGVEYGWGDHYKDQKEGAVYARIRAEELNCRRAVFSGSSNAISFRAGTAFELTRHYRDDFNAAYRIVELRHEGAQVVGKAGRIAEETTYRNEFHAIPAAVPFRPERTTPKPRVSGALNAVVDAAGTGEYAEIDSLGRYKVKLPFDLSGRGDGHASRFIRMAQPYAGADMGMHFPLHKGTEVVLLHANGDPDRPIIVGAVPNAETPSPVTGANQAQCAIHTSGGNQLEMDDTKGSQKIRLFSPHKNTVIEIGF